MNATLLRLSVRHPDYPGIRFWLCADGTEIAAIPGDQSFAGRYVLVYARADWDKGSFFGYPTRPGGDARLRTVARKFITHNGCAPWLAEEHGVDPSQLESEEGGSCSSCRRKRRPMPGRSMSRNAMTGGASALPWWHPKNA